VQRPEQADFPVKPPGEHGQVQALGPVQGAQQQVAQQGTIGPEPQAPAGPNINPKGTGKIFPTRTSVMPGISGRAVLKANSVVL